jgi:hypothetical protein
MNTAASPTRAAVEIQDQAVSTVTPL